MFSCAIICTNHISRKASTAQQSMRNKLRDKARWCGGEGKLEQGSRTLSRYDDDNYDDDDAAIPLTTFT